MAAIRYVVLDFDGTCTQIERIEAKFLADYGKAIGADDKAWAAALEAVRKASPTAGWTLHHAPSTAPAAADPYILCGEAAGLLVREKRIAQPPHDVFARLSAANVAPFRPELVDVLAGLAKKRINIGFISNSDSAAITTRIRDLLTAVPKLRDRVQIIGNAAKFAIRELPFAPAVPGVGPVQRARFEALPPAVAASTVNRPLYLRRGAYFEALCALYHAFGDDSFPIEKTLVCGDIWELDLAMPAVLGAQVHLIERAAPYATYPYELAAMESPKHVSANLKGLLKRV